MHIPKESEEQQFIFQWSSLNERAHPELKLLHSSMGGVRLRIGQAVKAKREGLKKGTPDLFLPVSRCRFAGLYIELKRIKGGTLSPEQKEWLKLLNEQGFLAVRCNGGKASIELIKAYLKNDLEKVTELTSTPPPRDKK